MSDLTSPGVQLVDLSDESPALSKILDRMDDAIDEKRFSCFLNCLFFDFSYSRVISSDLLEKIKSIDLNITDDELLALVEENDIKRLLFLFDIYPDLIDRLKQPINGVYPLDLALDRRNYKSYGTAQYLIENQVTVKVSTLDKMLSIPLFDTGRWVSAKKLFIKAIYLIWTRTGMDNPAEYMESQRRASIVEIIGGWQSLDKLAYKVRDLDLSLSFYDETGCTPLINAIKNNFLQQEYELSFYGGFLILENSDVNLADTAGKLPLTYAFEALNERFVDMLLQSGAQVTLSMLQEYESLPELSANLKQKCTKVRDTYYLYEIIKSGSITSLKSALGSKKFFLSMLDQDGYNALYHAANFAKPGDDKSYKIAYEMFNLLVDNGVNLKTDFKIRYKQLMFLLIKSKNISLLERAFELGASPYSANYYGKLFIHEAIDADSPEIVDLLLSKVEASEDKKTDFLCYAASHGSHVMLNHLLEKDGFDHDLRDNYIRSTPLLWACMYGKVTNIGNLLLKGANSNYQADDNLTPLRALSLSFKNNAPRLSDSLGKAVQWLLDTGAQVSVGDMNVVLHEDNFELFSLFLNHWLRQDGVSVDDISKFAGTFNTDAGFSIISDTFMFAAVNGHLETIKFILENDLEASNFIRYADEASVSLVSPLYICAASGKVDIVKYLIKDMTRLYNSNKETHTWILTDAFFGALEKQLRFGSEDSACASEEDRGDLSAHLKGCFCCDNHYESVNLLWQQLSDIPLAEASNDEFIRVHKHANRVRIKTNVKISMGDRTINTPLVSKFSEHIGDRCSKFADIIDSWFEKVGSKLAAVSEHEAKVAEDIKLSLENQLVREKLKAVEDERKRQQANQKKKSKQKLKKQQQVFKLPLGFLVSKFGEIESVIGSKSLSAQKLINSIDPILIQIYKDKNREKQLVKAQKSKPLKIEYEGKSDGLCEYLSEVGINSYKNERAHGLICSLIQSKNMAALSAFILLFDKVGSGIDCEQILIDSLGDKVSLDILESFDEVSLGASESSENLGSKLEYLLHLVGQEQGPARRQSAFAFASSEGGGAEAAGIKFG